MRTEDIIHCRSTQSSHFPFVQLTMECHPNPAAFSNGSSSLRNDNSAAAPPAPCYDYYTQIEVERYTFTWTIYNFSFCTQKTGQFLRSAIFSTGRDGKYKWRLRLYPKGQDEARKEFISVFLQLVSSDKTEVRAQIKISILNATEEKFCSSSIDNGFAYTPRDKLLDIINIYRSISLKPEPMNYCPKIT